MTMNSRSSRILIVDDEADIRRMLTRCLEPLETECLEAGSGAAALTAVGECFPEVVLLDVRLPDMNGLEVLRKIRDQAPETAVIMLTAFDDSRIAVEAIRNGAADYLTKPVDVDTLLHRVRRALEDVRMRRHLEWCASSEATPISFHGMVGRSPAIRDVFRLMQQIGPTDAPVLLHGESGTGKRLAAEILHRLSPRREGPFQVVDCGTIPTHLMESELFGYERGAFTGADRKKPGHLERAHRGSLLLDEIANLTPDGQAKLLRFLEEKIIFRLGGTEPIRLDVRIIAASNQPLDDCIRRGKFREDLYYRLNVFEIRLPPLRERIEDIPLLAEYFLSIFRDKYGKAIRGFRPEVISLLMGHAWPGNVRELRNVVERAVALSGDWIETGVLPDGIRSGFREAERESQALDDREFQRRARKILEETERRLIEEALERARGNRRRAAELLGISPRTLYYKLGKYFPKS